MPSAAARLAELDATDPSPSFNESARRVGVEPPTVAPGDEFLDLEVTLVAYWPDVPAALQEPRSVRRPSLLWPVPSGRAGSGSA